jgi:hypothetical protein
MEGTLDHSEAQAFQGGDRGGRKDLEVCGEANESTERINRILETPNISRLQWLNRCQIAYFTMPLRSCNRCARG